MGLEWTARNRLPLKTRKSFLSFGGDRAADKKQMLIKMMDSAAAVTAIDTAGEERKAVQDGKDSSSS